MKLTSSWLDTALPFSAASPQTRIVSLLAGAYYRLQDRLH